MPVDLLKIRVADAALHGAELRVLELLAETHEVEVVGSDTLVRQFRVTLRETPQVGGQPWPINLRCFTVRVSESPGGGPMSSSLGREPFAALSDLDQVTHLGIEHDVHSNDTTVLLTRN